MSDRRIKAHVPDRWHGRCSSQLMCSYVADTLHARKATDREKAAC